MPSPNGAGCSHQRWSGPSALPGTGAPCGSTFHLVFKARDVVAFEAALESWARRNLGDRGKAIAIDGKGLRGLHGEEVSGVRLVAAYCAAAGLVLAQSGGQAG